MRGKTPAITTTLVTITAHSLICSTFALKAVWVAAQIVASAISSMKYPLIRWYL